MINSKHPTYNRWKQIRKRCNNDRDKAYPNYGARGIKVCDRWMESFQNFVDDMGLPPSSGYSLDRINNDGNYEPDNCRWATHSTQMRNRRLYKTNKSGVTGVMFESGGWRARIFAEGKFLSLGRFNNKEEAIQARLAAEVKYKYPNSLEDCKE